MFIEYHYPFPIIKLPYKYSDLEPCIDRNTICLHYEKIYRKAVEKLNIILSNYPDYQNWNLEELIYNQDKLPTSIRNEVVFLSGRIFNHQIYFLSLTKASNIANYLLQKAIIQKYKTFDNFFYEIYKAGCSLNTCGYVWITTNEKGEINIVPTINEDTTIPLNLYPLIGIDIYEHAYYLKYPGSKEKYLSNIISLLNFSYANNEYEICLKQASHLKEKSLN